MADLTSLNRYKTLYAGITSDAQDARISAAISAISNQIETMLGFSLEATDYRSTVDGTGDAEIYMPNGPINKVYYVATYFLGAGTVYCSGAFSMASVEVASSAILLNTYSSADGTMTSSSVALAGKTLDTLATAVNAVSGWSLSVTSPYGTRPAQLLIPSAGDPALYPQIADVYIATEDGWTVRIVDNWSIRSSTGCEFPCGRANVFVHYNAGYTLPTNDSAGTLPAGLEMLVWQMVSDLVSSVNVNGLKQSESLGDYSYSLGDVVSIVERRKSDLFRYRRLTI